MSSQTQDALSNSVTEINQCTTQTGETCKINKPKGWQSAQLP